MSFVSRSGVLASLTATGFAAGASLAACAGAGGSVPAGLRVLVQLATPSDDAAAIAAAASRQAGVPVTYAAAASPAWHALALHCDSAVRCAAAVDRLRSAPAIYASVEIEGRKQKATQ
jgi:hypothetical protein